MTKRQISFQIDEKYIKEMENIGSETGLSVSRQIEMKLMGWSIVKETEAIKNESEIEVHDVLDVPYYSAREKVKEYLRNNVFISAVAEQTCLDIDVIEEVLHDLYEFTRD